ncbi:MAG: ribosome assembly RNA-binding protein YhbY [Alphaproteobacteria bacterium]|nr:ribosome assembly RNA-binding protein YhbY [Alphaproteobacteria bacterium]
MPELTGKQRRYLRGLGHHLDPVVMIGQRGLSDALERKVDAELENHELIKVRIGGGALEDAKEAGAALAGACSAALVQVVGNTALLYRPREDDPEIVLPR